MRKETFTDKIERIILNNSEYGSFVEKSAEETAAEIVALFEAEKAAAPDVITVPDAVAKLVEYFEKWFVHAIYVTRHGIWDVVTHTMDKGNPPDWVNAIINGKNSTGAVRVGLEDLFTTILTEEEK